MENRRKRSRKSGRKLATEKGEKEAPGPLVCGPYVGTVSEISKKAAGNDNKNNHLNKLNPDSLQAVYPLPGCGNDT